jgi:hydroxypyruvate isomerase
VPNHFLNSYSYALNAVKTVGSSNIKLMIDVFHMQMIQGNIVNSFKQLQDFIGHVQIAQAPNRNEPNSEGELKMKFVLQQIDKVYEGVIGCEYKPVGKTE